MISLVLPQDAGLQRQVHPEPGSVRAAARGDPARQGRGGSGRLARAGGELQRVHAAPALGAARAAQPGPGSRLRQQVERRLDPHLNHEQDGD